MFAHVSSRRCTSSNTHTLETYMCSGINLCFQANPCMWKHPNSPHSTPGMSINNYEGYLFNLRIPRSAPRLWRKSASTRPMSPPHHGHVCLCGYLYSYTCSCICVYVPRILDIFDYNISEKTATSSVFAATSSGCASSSAFATHAAAASAAAAAAAAAAYM